jgi:hypothetical protein
LAVDEGIPMDNGTDKEVVRILSAIRDRLGPVSPARSALASDIEAARHADPEFAIDDACNALRYFGVSLNKDEFDALKSAAGNFFMEDSLEGLRVN